MRHTFLILAAACAVAWGVCGSAFAADRYVIDGDHTSVNFKITHLGISWVQGRFNEVEGTAVLDADHAKSSFTMTIAVESIDTKVPKRDEHLRSADFFDVEQHPQMEFKSKRIRPTQEGGLEVTGDVTLHGMTRPLTFELHGGKTAEFPQGVHRIGYSTEFVLKRSDFGMKTMLGPIGDEVHAEISFEAVKQ